MDCSTFAFDLHVLGTPPALILSQDQTLMLNLLTRIAARQLFNARPIYWLCVVQSVVICRGKPPAAFARTDNSSRPILRSHALTLCPTSLSRLRARATSRRVLVCACTHYLVFKELTVCAPVAPR